MNTEERFLQKVVKTDACWFWVGSNNGVGYGEIRVKDKKIYAHRWSYEYYRGAIPDGYQVHHLCNNRSCVNPAHLEIVTPKEHARVDGRTGGTRLDLRKEFCVNGHRYSENTYWRPDGKGRNCAQCVRDRAREYQRRKNGYYDRHPEEQPEI